MRNCCSLLLVPVLCVLVGCGGGIGTVPVSGKVLVDGQPLEDVVVLFSPTASDGRAASGRTNASGEFVLTTEVNGDGALPGSYQVGVSKYEQDMPDALQGEVDPSDEAAMDAMYKALEKRGREVKSKALIAAKYTNPAGSGLTADVKEDGGEGGNVFTFEVSKK